MRTLALALASLFAVVAQGADTPYDCVRVFSFTGTGTQLAANSNTDRPCRSWAVTFTSTGFSTVTLSFGTSPDSTVSNFVAIPNTGCGSTSIPTPPCVISGASPLASGQSGDSTYLAYAPFYGIKVTNVTGSGTLTVTVYGYKGLGGGMATVKGTPLIFQATDPTGVCTVGSFNVQVTSTGAQYACVNNGSGPLWTLIIGQESTPQVFYYTNTASDIATYLQATAATFSPKTTLSFPSVSVGTAVLKNWATNAGVPALTIIPAGVYTQHIHAQKVSGGNVTFHTQFWEVDSTGVDIAQIGQTEESGLLPGSETEFTLEFADSNPYVLANVNSRIVGRVFATATGAGVSLRIFVGGTADTRIELPGVGTGGTGLPACAITFSGQTSVTITQGTSCNGTSTHGFATASLFIEAYDNATPRNLLAPGGVTVNATTFAVVVSFAGSTTGTIYITTGGTGPIGQTGATGATGAAGPPHSCTIAIGDPGAASPVLADDNDSPSVCGNMTGADIVITAVGCTQYPTGTAATINPVVTGGAAILASPLTCGTIGTFLGANATGTPTLHSFTGAATCGTPPCTLDANIATAGGVAKYLVIQVRF